MTDHQINIARMVRAGATVPEICMHNVKLGQGCFCPQCPMEPSPELREISRLRGIASTTLGIGPTSGQMRWALEQVAGMNSADTRAAQRRGEQR